MSAVEIGVSAPKPPSVPLAVRAAQAIFLVPFGLLQLVAALAFSVADGLHGAQYAVAAWAVAMATASVAVGLRLGSGGAAVRRAAFALIAAQTAFSIVKLTVYGESASFVFLAFGAVAAVLLLTARRD
jgi:hypothetical protein